MTATRYLVPTAVALAAGAGGLLLAGPAVVAPFVLRGVLAVHLLTTLPLAFLLAGVVPVHRAWAAVGIGTCVLTVWIGAEIGPWLEGYDVGFVARAGVRSTWCLGLALPWVLAFGPSFRTRPRDVAVALVIAGVIPAAYVARAGDARVHDLAEALRRGQAAKALRLADDLYQLGREAGPETGSADKKPMTLKVLRARLRRDFDFLTREAGEPLPASVSDRVVIARGVVLARLDRLAEAEGVFRPLADRDADAEISLATVLQSAERYEESSEFYRRAVNRAKPSVRAALARPGTPMTAEIGSAVDRLRRGFEGLAYNARMRKAYDEGAACYLEAIPEFPGGEAYFYFELGLHYASADRPTLAVRHFEAAACLAPAEFGPAAERHRALIRRDTPACVLFPGSIR